MPTEMMRSIFLLFALVFFALHGSAQFNIAERDKQEKQYINAQNQATSGYAAMVEKAIPPFIIYQNNKLQEFLANKPKPSLSRDIYGFTDLNQSRLDKYLIASRVSRADFFASDERKMGISTMLTQQKTPVSKNPLIIDDQVKKQDDLVATYLNKKKVQNEPELMLTTSESTLEATVPSDNQTSLKDQSVKNISSVTKSEILAAQYFPKTENKPIEETPKKSQPAEEEPPVKQAKQDPEEVVKNEVQPKPEIIVTIAEEKDDKNESLEEKAAVPTTTSEVSNFKEVKQAEINPVASQQEIEKTEETIIEPIRVEPSKEVQTSNTTSEENYNYDKTFDGVFFHLQVAALSEKKNNDVVSRSFNIDLPVKNIKHNGLYKFYTGSFSTYNEAKKRKDELRANGIDVFIIAIQANKIIDVKHLLTES